MATIIKNILTRIVQCAAAFLPRIITLLLLFVVLRIFEVVYDVILHNTPANLFMVFVAGLVKDVAFLLSISFGLFAGYFIIYNLHKKTANVIFVIISIVLCLVQVSLVQYFLTTLVPLGGDLWSYSIKDIKQTVGAAGGVPVSAIIIFIVFIALVIMLFIYLPRKVKASKGLAIAAVLVFAFIIPFNIAGIADNWKPSTNEYSNNLSLNKSYFFYNATISHFYPPDNDLDIYSDAYSGDFEGVAPSAATAFTYPDEANYPFLHKDETQDVLSPFLTKSSTKPNIVILLVEGLGRAFTNSGAYLGNFTPFVDSLSQHSLYWNNFLSAGGRTFAVLPSLIGSLPFAKNGFTELGENMPKHLSLISLLKHNGYETEFYYGGDSHFDNMDVFLRKNAIDKLNDIKSFPSTGYVQQPSVGGFSWGYGDKELFRRYMEVKPVSTNPYISIILTVSTHDPFLINEQQAYLNKFEQRMSTLGFDENRKNAARSFKMQYASILYTDDALRNFFTAYAQRPDFKNTIFLVTGDHRMPEIPMSDKLDRYHVPLLIYSPMLKRTATFASISNHFDITPTLLAYLKNEYAIETPALVSWMGSGIDTARTFRNTHAYPLMQTKSEFIDFIKDENMLNATDLYKINSNAGLNLLNDAAAAAQLTAAFDKFKQKNNRMLAGAKILPDSIYTRFFPK